MNTTETGFSFQLIRFKPIGRGEAVEECIKDDEVSN